MKKITLIFLLVLPLISSSQPGDWLVLNLKGYWKFHIGDHLEYASPYFDDDRWDEIFVPSPWENEGYHGYDGYAWYRVGFELNARTIDEESLYLDLGYIDDVDEVFVNGEKIGFTGSFPPEFQTAYNSRRLYHLPNQILYKDKPNTLAIRIFDTVLDGGIVSGTVGIFSTRDRLPPMQRLEGIWKIHENRDPDWRDNDYDDDRWYETMVPGFWQEMKYKSPKTRFATYRKTFDLAEYIDTNERLVLILGMVDDFDEVFLNGALIGKTKDYKPLGASESWRQYRIYDIPDGLIKMHDNVLTVEVEDIGGNAGIYQGPIAITYASNYRKVLQLTSWR